MSIHISFVLEPKKKLFKKAHMDFDKISAALKKYEKDGILRINIGNRIVHAEFCPEGVLDFQFKEAEQVLKGDCPTYLAGPGFHAAVVRFLEQVAKEQNLKLSIEDETGFARHKNFEKMKRNHYLPWLKFMMSLVCGQFSKSDYKLCWDIKDYDPAVISGTVITPIRRFTIDEIKEFYEQDPEVFAREFFVWNNEQRDSLFYRNSGLMILNSRCHFVFSDRNIRDGLENVGCIQNFEKALEHDRSLPFPKAEYRMVCRLHEQEPKDLEGVPELRHACELGYRRQEVYHKLGEFTYSIYGSCLDRIDRSKNTMFYYDDEPGHWHNIRITPLSARNSLPAFDSELFEGPDVEGVMDFPVGDGQARLAIRRPVKLEDSPEGCYYEMTAQMILDNQMLLVTQTYCRAEERKNVIQWFKSFEGKRRR